MCGFSAFLFDGIFVGATASRTMRNSMFVASATFFAVYYLGKHFLPAHLTNPFVWNNILWTAFMAFLALRGILQALYLNKSVYSQIK